MRESGGVMQRMCRRYLLMLMPVAEKFGLDAFVRETIDKNLKNECAATESEVELLSRACDDERVSRREIPEILHKSYRRAYEDGDFERIRTLRRVGIYSKISAILLGEELRAINDE